MRPQDGTFVPTPLWDRDRGHQAGPSTSGVCVWGGGVACATPCAHKRSPVILPWDASRCFPWVCLPQPYSSKSMLLSGWSNRCQPPVMTVLMWQRGRASQHTLFVVLLNDPKASGVVPRTTFGICALCIAPESSLQKEVLRKYWPGMGPKERLLWTLQQLVTPSQCTLVLWLRSS